VPAIALGFRIGSDFMPQLDEGAFLLQTVLPAEAALEEVDRLNHRVEDILRNIPEVEDVVRRTGRAERTEDPMPHTGSDVLVVLKPARTRSLEELEADMRKQLEGPGAPFCLRHRSACGSMKTGRNPTDISFGSSFDVAAGRQPSAHPGVDGLTDLRRAAHGIAAVQIA
jgi:cobalt-zinc-cadmium resistance protein CzcA